MRRMDTTRVSREEMSALQRIFAKRYSPIGCNSQASDQAVRFFRRRIRRKLRGL